jgi:hypothetical protein
MRSFSGREVIAHLRLEDTAAHVICITGTRVTAAFNSAKYPDVATWGHLAGRTASPRIRHLRERVDKISLIFSVELHPSTLPPVRLLVILVSRII